MSAILDAITARIDAILFEGRGADGSLGTRAQSRSIPAGQFVRVAAAVRSEREPSHATSRAIWRAWESYGTNPPDAGLNANDPKVIHEATLALEVYYVAGNGLGGFARVAGSETAATLASDPTIAAFGDAARIREALSCPELFRANGDAPAVVSVAPIGDVDKLPSDGSYVLLRYSFRVRLWGARAYQP